ncbi:MAG: Do family serine endopeptidase [Treponemataceae bacterium]|nr:Do family serine endopeptidase [Treponemataceae bacterium]
MKSSYKFLSVLMIILTIPLFSCFSRGKEAENKFLPSFDNASQKVEIPKNSLSIIEALQDVNRTVSDKVLQSVVEVDVEETKTRTVINPFFFFGFPGEEDEDNGLKKEKEYKAQGLGSGVIVLKNNNTYYVLTNNHVAGSASKITVKLYDSREFECELVGHDERKDIALISFETKENLPVASLGDSDKVRTGDICFAMGAPLGYSSSVTQGIVSATGRSGRGIGNISDFIQTDASINQGNSGGPLVNIYGEVIGINTWIASSSGGSVGIGFAIPINNIKKAISDFVTSGKVSYGWLGVSLFEADKDTLKELGIENQKGALVAQLFLGSPAAKGGMMCGDYIIALNGKDVKDVNQLVRDVGELRAGESAEFTVIRNGEKHSYSVKIEGRDDKVVNDSSKLFPGFSVSPLTDEIRKKAELPRTVEGVLVYGVMQKSPATTLRLQNGDIITRVNGRQIHDMKDFYRELSSNPKEVWFEIYSEDGHTYETQKFKF